MFLVLLGCEEEGPCDRYADYICVCHADDPAFDCNTLRAISLDSTQAASDQCAVDLQEQRDEDEAAGLICDA
jgi:hypothetical protein